MLRPGERITALTLKKSAQTQDFFNRFSQSMPMLSFRICYCSVLGECWTSDLRDLNQAPVSACPVPRHQFVPGR